MVQRRCASVKRRADSGGGGRTSIVERRCATAKRRRSGKADTSARSDWCLGWKWWQPSCPACCCPSCPPARQSCAPTAIEAPLVPKASGGVGQPPTWSRTAAQIQGRSWLCSDAAPWVSYREPQGGFRGRAPRPSGVRGRTRAGRLGCCSAPCCRGGRSPPARPAAAAPLLCPRRALVPAGLRASPANPAAATRGALVAAIRAPLPGRPWILGSDGAQERPVPATEAAAYWPDGVDLHRVRSGGPAVASTPFRLIRY